MPKHSPASPQAIDTLYLVETPEGVELELHPAALASRGLALMVDQIFVWTALAVCMSLLMVLGPSGLGLWLILLFLTQWLYPVFCEVLLNGQTFGKRIAGLRVLMANGLPITWRASLLRNLLRVVDALPFGYTVGLISVLCTARFQRLGDLVADTLVVHVPKKAPSVVLPEVPPIRPTQRLQLSEQAAILNFCERSTRLSPERATELAELLEPLTHQKGEAALKTLQGTALYLLKGEGDAHASSRL